MSTVNKDELPFVLAFRLRNLDLVLILKLKDLSSKYNISRSMCQSISKRTQKATEELSWVEKQHRKLIVKPLC